jgi:peroxiredoxin
MKGDAAKALVTSEVLPGYRNSEGIRRRIAVGIFVVGLAALGCWRFVPSQATANHTYDHVAISGRWVFPPFPGRATDDPIYLAFQKGWGHPAGDDRLLAKGAWKARMTALCALSKLGKDAIPVLLRGLDDKDDEVRELAAQAIGYLGDSSVIERLDQAIRLDPSATVRIYAAIAHGSISGDLPEAFAQEILQNDPHSMVRSRLELTRQRGSHKASSLARDGLASFDLAKMDSARIDVLAPDFSLVDLDGQVYQLSDFRGKKDVVLVFVYGVTCMFCTGQIGNLKHKLDEFESLGAKVLIVEANDPYRVSATISEAMSKKESRLPVLLDPAHTVAATYGVAMQMNHIEWLNRPSTFLIDRQGILRQRFLADNPTDRPSPSVLLDAIKRIQAVANPPVALHPHHSSHIPWNAGQ